LEGIASAVSSSTAASGIATKSVDICYGKPPGISSIKSTSSSVVLFHRALALSDMAFTLLLAGKAFFLGRLGTLC